MNARLLNVLHHPADEGFAFGVAQAIDIALDGVVQETVKQHRRVVRNFHRFAHVAFEVTLLVHDFHGAATQHVARTHHQGIAQGSGFFQSFWLRASRGVGRLAQAEFLQEFLKTLAVFGSVDHVGAGANDRHASGFQTQGQFERRLTAVLHDDAGGFFFVHNFQHVFERQGLEVQTVGGVVVGGDGLGVAVDHDGLVTVFTHGQSSMDAAIIKLDALSNAIGTATEHHDFFVVRGFGFAFVFVARIHVSSVGGKLCGAGVHAFVHGAHVQRMAFGTHVLLVGFEQLGQATV